MQGTRNSSPQGFKPVTQETTTDTVNKIFQKALSDIDALEAENNKPNTEAISREWETKYPTLEKKYSPLFNRGVDTAVEHSTAIYTQTQKQIKAARDQLWSASLKLANEGIDSKTLYQAHGILHEPNAKWSESDKANKIIKNLYDNLIAVKDILIKQNAVVSRYNRQQPIKQNATVGDCYNNTSKIPIKGHTAEQKEQPVTQKKSWSLSLRNLFSKKTERSK